MSSKAPVVRLERSAEERTKYPDRINLDRRGLHGVPVLAEEPGLRLLSLQHNFIKKIHNLGTFCYNQSLASTRGVLL